MDIFTYTDYRKYLADAWSERKGADRHFSHRAIANRAGFSSPAFFGRILSGEANLTPSAALKLAGIFRLNRSETRYFEHLVMFDQARSAEERAMLLDQIVAWRKGAVPQLAADRVEFCRSWWVVVIRELLDLSPTSSDPQVLAKMVVPSITPDQARNAIDLLDRLGLITRDEDGIWHKTDATLTTGDMADEAIDAFRKDTLRLASEAIDRFPREERSITTLTVTLSNATLDRLRDRLRHLRREILEMAREDAAADQVVQVNFQAFPVGYASRRTTP